ncbi:hypothetical protein [Legionella saoudiensis]|uniref:hypothetical protein n=1 Tax=Legionella saoudiensis TaxID=1750561 RepID=UPI000731B160|nr:hypothetical protein [Legionella saoudiensis]
MTDFFNSRTRSQLVGDVGVGALNAAKNGIFGGLLIGATLPTIGSLVMTASAAALGGALLVIPAMMAYKASINAEHFDSSFFTYMENTGFKAAFSFTAGCLGAAILGTAILQVGLACLAASLTFSLLNKMTQMIIDATAPSKYSPENHLVARMTA